MYLRYTYLISLWGSPAVSFRAKSNYRWGAEVGSVLSRLWLDLCFTEELLQKAEREEREREGEREKGVEREAGPETRFPLHYWES